MRGEYYLGDGVPILDLADGLVLGRDLVILLAPAVVTVTPCHCHYHYCYYYHHYHHHHRPVLALLQLLVVKSWPSLSSDRTCLRLLQTDQVIISLSSESCFVWGSIF